MKTEEIMKKLMDFKREVFYQHGGLKKYELSKIYNKNEFVAKSMRSWYFMSGDMNTHKHIIPIKRLRSKKETLMQLHKNGEIAAVIEGREEFPDFEIVLDRQYIKHLNR